MIVAFIGPDMTGKSNIAIKLSQEIDLPVFKNTGEWKATLDSEDYYLNLLRFGGTFLMDFLVQTKPSAILDRFYPCELVYSQVFNRKTNRYIIEDLDKKFASIGGKFIFCYKECYAEIKDDLFPDAINEKNLLEIENGYRDFLSITSCDVLELETSDMDLKSQVSKIRDFLGV
jgi:hypothetical protein